MKKRGLKIFSILVLSKSGSVFAKKVVLGSYLQKISYLICRIAQVGGGGVVGWGPSVGGALTAVGQHVGGVYSLRQSSCENCNLHCKHFSEEICESATETQLCIFSYHTCYII
jgi:hypothetical protein